MFRYKFLNRIFYISLAAVLLLPIYTVFFMFPLYTDFAKENVEETLVDIADHMASSLIDKSKIDAGFNPSDYFVEELKLVSNTLNLWKVKIFTPEGKVVYSSETNDVGTDTRHDFFRDIVNNRKPHSVVINKEIQTGQQTRQIKLIETYVPIFNDEHEVVGVFEIYFDITGITTDLGELSAWTHALLFLISICLLGTVIIVADRAGRSMDEHARTAEERKKLQEELVMAHKAEAITTLVGGIAHDFNNILTAVLVNIHMTRKEIEEESRLFENLTNAQKAVLVARDLTRQLTTIARNEPMDLQAESTVKIIEKSIPEALKGSRSKMVFSFGLNLWPILVDKELFVQALLVIVNNADQAMAQVDGGTIKIRAYNAEDEETAQEGLGPGNYVKISIIDQGRGIAPDKMAKVFDPYFSTKDKSSERGTGLGLAFCKSIIDRHNGHIKVESTEGEGTAFHIYMPAKVQDK